MGKDKWEPEKPLPLRKKKRKNKRMTTFPEGLRRSVRPPDVRDVGCSGSCHTLACRTAVDYDMHSQAVTPDRASSLEQFNASSGTSYAAIDLINGFSPIPVHQATSRCSSFSAGKASDTSSLSFIRGISTLQPDLVLMGLD